MQTPKGAEERERPEDGRGTDDAGGQQAGEPVSTVQIDLWRSRHRFCTMESAPMSVEEARFVLLEHSGHGGGCLQFAAALRRISEVPA
jgi:hypothetical protein